MLAYSVEGKAIWSWQLAPGLCPVKSNVHGAFMLCRRVEIAHGGAPMLGGRQPTLLQGLAWDAAAGLR